MSVFAPHFTKVYNNHQPVDFGVHNQIPQRKTLLGIDSPITFGKVNKAINKCNASKSPGLNGQRRSDQSSMHSHQLPRQQGFQAAC
jgi:hypothetical protein